MPNASEVGCFSFHMYTLLSKFARPIISLLDHNEFNKQALPSNVAKIYDKERKVSFVAFQRKAFQPCSGRKFVH